MGELLAMQRNMVSSMAIISKKEKEIIKKLKRCEIAAKVALKYGPPDSENVNERHFLEFLGEEVNHKWYLEYITPSNIKWFIHNKMTVDDPIWNADFISGLTKTGIVNWSRTTYPSFSWWGSPILLKILKDSPYYGVVTDGLYIENGKKKQKAKCRWQRVPALYLKPRNDSLSYLAGLLCTGRVHKYKKESYILYNKEVMEELLALGIPVEDELKVKVEGKEKFLVSPFWTALFTKFMPECCHSYFLNIYKPFHAELYASIFWSIFVGHEIIKGGLPYLPSRRTVMYHYKNEGGTIKNLQRLRIKYNLLGIDRRFKECIKLWIEDSHK